MADPTLVNWSAVATPTSGSSFTFTPAHQPTDGNYLVFGMFQYNGSGGTTATVTWTNATGLAKPATGTWPFMLNTNTTYPYTADLWWKVAASEPASYTVGLTGVGYGLVFLAEYSGADSTYSFDAVQVTYADTSVGASSGTFPAMTPSVTGALLANIFYESNNSDTLTVPSQLTGHGQTANSIKGQVELADADATSTAAVGPFTWAWAPGTYPTIGGMEFQLPPASGTSTVNLTIAATTAPGSIGTPALAQVNALAVSAASGAGHVGSAVVGQVHGLATTAITGAASIGASSVMQAQRLSIAAATGAASIGRVVVKQAQQLTVTAITGAASIGSIALNAGRILIMATVTGAGTVGSVALQQTQRLSAAAIAGAANIGVTGIAQTQALGLASVTGAARVGTVALSQVARLSVAVLGALGSIGSIALALVGRVIAPKSPFSITAQPGFSLTNATKEFSIQAQAGFHITRKRV